MSFPFRDFQNPEMKEGPAEGLVILPCGHRSVKIRKHVSLQMNGFSLLIQRPLSQTLAGTSEKCCELCSSLLRASAKCSPSGFYEFFH